MLQRTCFVAAILLVTASCDNGAPVMLRFAARIGGADFHCGASYPNVGTPATTVLGSDFRFFVSQVRLIDDSGAETPVTLDQDGKWQYHDLALLDFEDGTSLCATYGNTPTNTVVMGRAPAGHYTGIHFVLGLPFAENFMDEATAPSPLSVSGMWWNWAGGHQLLRVDTRAGSATGNGFIVHVGDTDCVTSSGVAQSCAHENNLDVRLTGFDPTTGTVVADFARIAAGSDPTTNAMDTALGCQSDTDDPDCAPVFQRLGLAFGATPAMPQQLFTVE